MRQRGAGESRRPRSHRDLPSATSGQAVSGRMARRETHGVDDQLLYPSLDIPQSTVLR